MKLNTVVLPDDNSLRFIPVSFEYETDKLADASQETAFSVVQGKCLYVTKIWYGNVACK